MNHVLKYVAYSIGAFVLFIGSFLGFAAFSGTPLNKLAVVGGLFPEDVKETPSAGAAPDPMERVENDARPAEEVVRDAALPLHTFVLDSALPAAELNRLQTELKSLIRENELRSLELDNRAKELELRAQHYDDRWKEIETIRTNLMKSELELEQRKGELDRDQAAQEALEKESWKSLASIFADGKAKVLVSKLTQYEPESAAKILRALPDARAAELLAEIPDDRYIAYTEAYRKAEK